MDLKYRVAAYVTNDKLLRLQYNGGGRNERGLRGNKNKSNIKIAHHPQLDQGLHAKLNTNRTHTHLTD